MNQDELIEKCMPTDKEIADNFPVKDPDLVTSTDRNIARTAIRSAIPVIEAEARKAEREKFLEWLWNRRATSTAVDIYLQAKQALKGEDDAGGRDGVSVYEVRGRTGRRIKKDYRERTEAAKGKMPAMRCRGCCQGVG